MNAKRFRHDWLANYRWLIEVIIYLTIIIFAIIQFLVPKSINMDSERYLLSAISQGLAALLGMTFTISLIMLQVSYKEPRLLGDFFKEKFNALYPIIMAFGVIFPLAVLKIEWYGSGTNVAIALCIVSVFLIIPYFLRMKNYVWLPVGAALRFERAKEALQMNDLYVYRTTIDDMVDLVKTSSGTNYRVHEYCHEYLCDLGRYWVRRVNKDDEIMTTTMAGFCEVLSMMPERRIRHKEFPELIDNLANSIVRDFNLKDISVFEKLLASFGAIEKSADDPRVRPYLDNAALSLSSSWIEQNRRSAKEVRKYLRAHVDALERPFSISGTDSNPDRLPETAKSQARYEIKEKLLDWLKEQNITNEQRNNLLARGTRRQA